MPPSGSSRGSATSTATGAGWAVVKDAVRAWRRTRAEVFVPLAHRQLSPGQRGLVVPDASEAMRHHAGHVWFMCVFLVLAAVAPALVRLFERAPLIGE